MKKTIVVTMIVFFMVSGICLAKGPGPMGEAKMLPDGKWWKMPKIAQDLDLTGEEQTKLDDLFIQSKRKMIDLKSDVEKEKLELEQIMEKKDFDEPACMAIFKKLKDAGTRLATERFGFLVEVRKLLGADRFLKLKAKFQMYRRNNMQRHPYRSNKRMQEEMPNN